MRDEPIHLWEVGASKPVARVEGGLYHPDYTNVRFGVVARTMERVMELAWVQYGPDIRFHSIIKRNYMGEAQVIVDPDVAATVIRDGYGKDANEARARRTQFDERGEPYR